MSEQTTEIIKASPHFRAMRAAINATEDALEQPPDESYKTALLESSSEQRRMALNLPLRHWQRDTSATRGLWRGMFEELNHKCGKGLLYALVGIRGTGKTQIGTELLRRHKGWFCTAMEFFLELKSSFRKDSAVAEAEVLQRYQAFPLLVIDEMQERSDSPWEDRLLVHLLNKRYNALKDTLLISNQKPEEFQQAIGPSLASRMMETGGIIECNWESFRQ